MKKILNGRRWDTEKATLIGHAELNPYQNDFGYWEAGLYITPRSKEFFIAGHGGPMSRFGRSVRQNETSGGSDIILMSKTEALEFAEQYLDAEEFEKYFKIEDA